MLPHCDLLQLAYARFEEGANNAPAARSILEACVAQRPTPVNFISLLRFARRAEGLWQARNIFARARKAEGCTWHVYAAAAQIELNLTGAKGAANEDEGARVAAKIYAMAFERFEGDVGFVRHYLDFLQSQRDHGTMRAVLERVLQSAVGAGCRELWHVYAALEHAWGDVASARAIDARRAAAFPAEATADSLASLALSLSFEGLVPGGLQASHCQIVADADPRLGGAKGANGPTKLVTPDLSLCVEYTGLPSQTSQPTEPSAPAATGGLALLPQELAALASAALGAPTPASDPSEAAMQVQRLMVRLNQLPDSYAQLPAAAGVLGGGAHTVQGGAAVVHQRPAKDLYTSRQKRQKS